jgi:hypothetical protein
MKTLVRSLLLFSAILGGILLSTLYVVHEAPAIAQSIMRVSVTSLSGHAILPPPYLKATNLTTTGTFVIKTSAGVVGCAVINTAGAASSTIKLYATNNLVSYGLKATIDATQVGRLFCYGAIFSDGITVVVASGGTAPDVTILYQ